VKWDIDKSRPICPQICEQICVGIINGEFLTKQKLQSVRELAVTLGVNPNTVQKSYDLLEEEKVIYSVRGSGWYVEEDTSVAANVVNEICLKKTDEYLLMMRRLGCDFERVLEYLKERKGDNDE
jgi:GntR family transcriptional regulator